MITRDCVRMFLLALCSVSGISKASSQMPLPRREEIAAAMLDYLRNAAAAVIDQTGRADAANCTVWLLAWACPWT